jgi:DNA invertase Pin-like site-specific DNA recombinase
MNIGYARVSTTDQTLNLQLDELKSAGCEKIFEDVASGAKTDRQGLIDAIEFCRPGDVLVCWKLDRVGRSLKDLIEIVNALRDKGVGFRCLTQQLDTTTPSGMLIFHVFGAMAEFERSLIQERTKAGLVAARARGRRGGRPKLDNGKRAEVAKTLHKGKTPVSEICQTLKISRATFYRALKASVQPDHCSSK